jgi:hypothetical protein
MVLYDALSTMTYLVGMWSTWKVLGMADVQELTLSDGIHMLIYPSKWYGWN